MIANGRAVAVRAWHAWAPDRETPAQWLAWAGASSATGMQGANAPPLPMALKRRATPLGQKLLAGALGCGGERYAGRCVLASRHGEFSRTLNILEALAAGEAPSPADFSMSVHHALAGLLSIHTGSTAGHTAIAAGADTFGMAMLEATATLAEDAREPVLLLYGDDPLPGAYADFDDERDRRPLVAALALATPGPGEPAISIAVEEGGGAGAATGCGASDFLRFLLSGADSACSHGALVRWRWQRAT